MTIASFSVRTDGLTAFSASFFVGIALGSILPSPLISAAFFLLIACAALGAGLRGRGRSTLLVSLCAALCAVGILHGGYASMVRFASLDENIEKRIVYEGVIVRDPDSRTDHVNLTVGALKDTASGNLLPKDARILLYAPRYPEFHYGDRVSFAGVIKLPEPFSSDDGGRIFDYPAFLAKDGIGYVMYRPVLTLIATGQGNPLLAALFKVKHGALDGLTRALPEPAAGLAAGLIFGEKRAIGDDLAADFRIAGIAHIVVLSGYNMTLVADGIAKGLGAVGAGFVLRIGGGVIGIILFALMVGGGGTVLRAAIMALFALLARASGRQSEFGRALIIAGVLMVAANPRILLFDPSFQLSFLASLGLVYVAPPLERALGSLGRFAPIKEHLVGTLATQLTVLPLLLYMNGHLSLLALPVNLLVLPVVSSAMFLGGLAALFALFSLPLALIIAGPATLLLLYIVHVAVLAARVPFAEVELPPFGPVVLASLYILIALLLWRLSRPRSVLVLPES